MRIELLEDPTLEETEVTIRCAKADDQVLRLLALLRVSDRKLTGLKDGETFLLNAGDILYIDTVDQHTFLYAAKEVYETPLRLYELLERLEPMDFFRAGKSSIINFRQIQSLRPDFGGRMRCTMNNGEVLFISRQYVPGVRARLGLT